MWVKRGDKMKAVEKWEQCLGAGADPRPDGLGQSIWALFIILIILDWDPKVWRCLLAIVHLCVRLRKECACERQHTDGRLIKQLIKARELGSEMRLLMFGKNCSTHHKKEGERRTGRAGRRKGVRRETIRAISQECVRVCLIAPPSPLPPPHTHSTLSEPSCSLFLFLCLCVWTGADIAVALSLHDSNQKPQETSTLRRLWVCKHSQSWAVKKNPASNAYELSRS